MLSEQGKFQQDMIQQYQKYIQDIEKDKQYMEAEITSLRGILLEKGGKASKVQFNLENQYESVMPKFEKESQHFLPGGSGLHSNSTLQQSHLI